MSRSLTAATPASPFVKSWYASTKYGDRKLTAYQSPLAARGARLDGNCVAVVPLPDYPIATVRTGQYDGTGALWTAEFAPDGE